MPVKSPLNYTGNKYRILEQIQQYFPDNINVMIDLFCGGATVGINTNSNVTYFIDKNLHVINLLTFLSKQDFQKLMIKLERIIAKYNLSYSYKKKYKIYRSECSNKKDNNGLKEINSKGFYKLRDHYNSLKNKNTQIANCELYLLMVYGFNNDIRFNDEGEFNLPVGKTDLNKQNVKKLQEFINKVRSNDYRFICSDFTSPKVVNLIEKADFIYMDPPYLITDAVYNSFWSEEKEIQLLSFIDKIIEKGKTFALSNIIRKTGKENYLLIKWIERHPNIFVHNIEYNYKSSSYNKKIRNANEEEVLITNLR